MTEGTFECFFPRWPFEFLPATHDDVAHQASVRSADDNEEPGKNDWRLEAESLAIEQGCGFIVDGLADAHDNRIEEAMGTLVLGVLFAVFALPAWALVDGPIVWLVFGHDAWHDGFIVVSGDQIELSAGVNETKLVDHVADFGRQVQEAEREILFLLLLVLLAVLVLLPEFGLDLVRLLCCLCQRLTCCHVCDLTMIDKYLA